MSAEGIVQLVFITFVGGGLSALLWHRLNRFEARLEGAARKEDIELLRKEVHEEFRASRAEINEEFRAFRAEINDEIRGLRAEINDEIRGLRSDLTQVRSDITQVALAVGARRPQASPG